MKTQSYLLKKPLNALSLVSVLCILFFTNMQCKKDKLPIDQLPAATQTGANTFGFLINGQAFTPTTKIIYNYIFNYVYNPSSGLSIEATNDNRDADYLGHIYISLLIPNLIEGRTYTLTDYNVVGKGGVKYLDISGPGNVQGNYETTSQAGGSITITKCDLVKKIISGTFSFSATDMKSLKTINVTDGRFDLTFK